MVFRTEAIRRRLARLEQVISTLAQLDYDPSSLEKTWSVERGLHVATECIFDIGNHILSAHFGASIDGYEQILDALTKRGVIDEELRTDLAGLGGFRNVLVHGYLDLDTQRVEEALQKGPKQFSDYHQQIAAWIANQYGA